jgi:hypothetical protein
MPIYDGDMDMKTWRHGDVETGRYGRGDMDAETWTLRHHTWTLKYCMDTWNFKLKTKNGSPGDFP